MALYRDKFRDWNWLHKGVVILLASFFTSLLIRAIYVIENGQFEVTAEQTLPYDTSTIWPWVTDIKNRSRWQAQIVDLTRLSGDPVTIDSTRFVFWQRGGKRWSSLEATREVLNERMFRVVQESDFDTRRFEVELIPNGACRTTVKLREIVRDKSYKDRFIAVLDYGAFQERLDVSLTALDNWLKNTSNNNIICNGEP